MSHSKARTWVSALLAMLLMVGAAGMAFAQASGVVDEDASVYTGATDTYNPNTDKLRVEAGTPTCEASRSRWTYLKWAVGDAAGKAGDYAKITLTADYIQTGVAVPAEVRIALYETTDGWTETTLPKTGAGAPLIGDFLDDTEFPTSVPSPVVFEGGAGSALVTYIMQEANGDGTASFVVALTGDCGEGSVIVRTYSKDQTNAAVKPVLDLRSGGPTAVNMVGANAERVSWPLYVGLGALGVMVALGIVVTRRKTA